MIEWLILLLLVPAIVVPVVLLVGFAGCNPIFGLEETTLYEPPVIEAAEGKSVRIVGLAWKFNHAAAKFLFERTWVAGPAPPMPGEAMKNFEKDSSPADDTDGLVADTTYSYRVRPVYSDDTMGGWSTSVPGTTLPFEPAFEAALPFPEGGWAGFCLVQRIEAAELSRSGNQVLEMTLRAASDSAVSIDRIVISKPHPGAGRDPYDPADDRMEVMLPSTPLVVPMGEKRALTVDFILEQGQALLIAIDFSAAPPAPPSGIAFVDPAPLRGVAAYWASGAHAAQPDRTFPSSNVRQNRIYLIEKIGVG